MARLLTVLMTVAGTLMAGISGAAAEEGEKFKISSFVDEVILSGDIRIREETRWYSGDTGTGKTHRQRFRLRIAGDIKEGPIVIHARLATGTGEHISSNQSFQKLSSQKGVWVDRAFVELNHIPNASLMAGRMKNPFFTNGTTAIVWDDDYNPEGFAETYTMNLDGLGRAFATAGQMVLDGGGAGATAQWLLGLQGGTEIKTDPAAFNVAVLYYTLANGGDGSFSQSIVQDGNTRVGGGDPTLANPFHVVNATAAVKFTILVPAELSADIVRNMSNTNQGAATDENTGFAVGIVIGKAKKPNSAELGYQYRSIDTDATLADLADSDFGPNGGTNREGHVLWTAYNLTEAAQFKVRFMSTKVINEDLPPAPITGDEKNPSHFRLQADFSVKY